ncbi:MAG: type I polyketide synthase, partial [Myxococcales bacterium]|nr:type I polyketide synthase [Myxococcales bacterium]
ECHGTGTPVGDPIEVTALTQAFREETEEVGFCGIGSVKTNIGHLDTAAGVASLIKTVQALKHRELPPSLHFDKPNPQIDFAASPFYVNASLKPWETDGTPRRAGINSLGVGGTNAFVLVEEAPEVAASERPSRPLQLTLLSARSADAVDRAGERLAAHLKAHPELDLADVAYTLVKGRKAFNHRRMVVARDAGDAAAALESRDPARVFTMAAGERRSVAFLFPGGGAQYPNMGRELYELEPVYREEVDRGLEVLGKHADFDLKPLLFPAEGDEEKAGEELQHGSRTLPALFITEYALAKLFMSWGIEPSALLGHSMGEYVAACLAGVFSMEDGLRMVLKRGQLFEKLERGAMLSVPMSREELAARIGPDLDVAVVNGPMSSVASGPVEKIEALEKALLAEEIDARRIRIHVAAHSRMLDPILAEFGALTKTIALSPPEKPILSNVSGTWMTAEQATDPDYWVKHLRGTVQFSDNLATLLEDAERVVLEVSPGRTLSSLAKAHPAAGLGRPVFNSLRHPKEEVGDLEFLLGVVGRLWLTGVDIDVDAFFGDEERRRVVLPSYPFEHQRYWIEPGKTKAAAASLKKKANVADWFYQPSWKRQLLPATSTMKTAVAAEVAPWVVFSDESAFAERLIAHLREAGHEVSTVIVGSAFSADGDGFTLRPAEASDYEALIDALEKRERPPRQLLHLWSLVEAGAPEGLEANDRAQKRGFYSLLFLAQAIGAAGIRDTLNLGVVHNGLQQVAAEPILAPERATVLGPCRVMMQELPNVTCRSIDIELPEAGSWRERLLLERLPQELLVPTTDHTVAYRGHERLVATFEPTRLPATSEGTSRLQKGGTYLVTGGL